PASVRAIGGGARSESGSTVAFPQPAEGGADELRFAAFRASGAVALVPGEHVDMRPLRLLGDESLEIECGGDGAGESAFRDVVQVGHIAVEILPIAVPERQAPDRVGFAFPVSKKALGQAVVIAEQCRKVRSQGNAGRSGQRGAVDYHV